jgi:RNA polymerase sigma-70 factor (ECF subfamily)
VEETDDLALVDRFKNGDEMAFNLIVDRYSGKILSMASYFLKNSDDAYDVAQEVFVKIHRSLHKFRGDSKLSTWIHTIAANTCKNKLSFWKRLATRKREYEKAQKVFYQPWTPHDEVEQSERVRIIRENILALPEKYRMVILLKDLRGFSYEEIARMLQIQEGTVKSRLHRAREKLAGRLAPIFRNQ